MPCYDGREAQDREEERNRLDLATSVACEVLGKYVIHYSVDNLSKEARNWWSLHQAEDKRQKTLEEEARYRRRIKTAALAKLTADERKALGL